MVARQLIGKILVHDHPDEGRAAGRIVETEAYRGPADLAAHSAGGRRTKRTEAMWGEPGYAYMFLLYGMHWAFNVVTGNQGQPHAVLVRAIEPVGSMTLMERRRGMSAAHHRGRASERRVSNGPGKLCAALGLDGSHYGADLCGDTVFIIDAPSSQVGRSPRINIDYAGAWVTKPWRFYERGNRYVSVPPR